MWLAWGVDTRPGKAAPKLPDTSEDSKMKKSLLGLVVASVFAGGAHAATIIKITDPQSNIPGLTGFATTGAMMDGLSITATFVNGGGTLLWADTGAISGGVSAANWSLSLSGDSFSSNWVFNWDAGVLGNLLSLKIDGTNALTVLDTSDPSPGTDDSASGADFAITSSTTLNDLAIATYSAGVGIIPNAPVGDLFQVLTVTFGADGISQSFTFRQDTDNDSRAGQVPAPATLGLLGLALAGLGVVRRRQKS